MKGFSLLTDVEILLDLMKKDNTVIIDSIPYKNVNLYKKVNVKKRSLVKPKDINNEKCKGNK